MDHGTRLYLRFQPQVERSSECLFIYDHCYFFLFCLLAVFFNIFSFRLGQPFYGDIGAQKVRSLCGNFNENVLDDFQPPGITEIEAKVFGDSWRLQKYCPESSDYIVIKGTGNYLFRLL